MSHESGKDFGMASAASGLTDFLSPSELSRLDRLALLTRGRGVGYAGAHQSTLPGHGVAFVDRRRYEPGDDPRAVDWRLLGRTDKLYIRRFEREADMGVALLVDQSVSMDFAGLTPRGHGRSKHEHALRLAAAIGYLALRRRDRVVVAANHGQRIQPAASPRQLASVLRERHGDAGQPTLSQIIARMAARLDRHMTLVVISDLLEPIEPTRRAIAWAVGRGLNVVLWQILHADEWRVPIVVPEGMRLIVNPETGLGPRVNLRLSRAAYGQRIDRFLASWSRVARDCGAAHWLFLGDQNLLDRLAAWLHASTPTRPMPPVGTSRLGAIPP